MVLPEVSSFWVFLGGEEFSVIQIEVQERQLRTGSDFEYWAILKKESPGLKGNCNGNEKTGLRCLETCSARGLQAVQ